MLQIRTLGRWAKLLGGIVLCVCLMAPGCAPDDADVGHFTWMGFIDPPTQGTPPVPAVPYHALLVRQSDCSLTRLVFDQSNALLSSYPNYQDFLHQLSGLTSTADQFSGGCKEPTTGIASQFGAFLGRTNTGNYAIATIVAKGVQITLATPSFTIASTMNIAIGDPLVLSSTSVATADLDGDGIADLVVASAGATFSNPVGTLTVFTGKGDGTFATPRTINLPFDVQGFTIDDLNKDGKLDIVAVAFPDINASASHLAVLLGHGDGTFDLPVLGPPNVTGNNVVTGDFNGDGKKDVATTDGYILLGNGDGTFTVPFGPQFLTQFIGIAAGDFNRDGRMDLAITTDTTRGTVDIYLGAGDGHFSRSVSYAGISGAQSISALDLDGDGNTDLFVGTQSAGVYSADVVSNGEFQSLLGRGDGTFAAAVAITSTPLTSGIKSFDVGDVTGDTKADLVFVDSAPAGAYLSVYSGSGDANFTRGTQTPVSGFTGGPLLIADVNRDGKNDAVFAIGSVGTAGIAVALGNGDGSFQTPAGYAISAPVSSLVASDLNGDGKPDLIFVADPGSSPSTQASLQVMLNKGDGTYFAAQQIDAKAYQFFVAAADVNGDGKADLVVTAPGNIFSSVSGSTTLYLGTGNGSFQAPIPLVGGANPGPVTLVDLNNDGKLDVVIAGSTSSSAGSVSVLLGNGNGTFQAAISSTAGFVVANSIAAGDVDKDGKLDLIVTECCGSTNTWLFLGSGNGSVVGTAHLPLGLGGGNARLVDLNGDGYADLVLTSHQYAIEIFPASTAAAVPTIATATTLAASAPSLAAGQTLTLSVTVSASSGSSIPNGSVTFFDGTTALGTVALDGLGKATLVTSSLVQGSHGLRATYGGSATFASSSSSTVTVQVTAPAADFSVSASPVSVTVPAGQTGTVTLTVTPLNGSTQTVTVSCGTLPAYAFCGYAPASNVTLNGTQPSTVTVTIRTNATASLNRLLALPALASFGGGLGGVMFTLAIMGTALRRRVGKGLLVLAAGLVIVSCGGGGGYGGSATTAAPVTPSGSYPVTITLTSGTLTHTVNVMLAVQ